MNGFKLFDLFKFKIKTLFWRFGLRVKLYNTKDIGDFGEDIAKQYLKKLGFKILSTNWRSRRDKRNEIDLVCSDMDCLVFIEVKTRSSNSLCKGYESINFRKRKALQKTFKDYLKENQNEFMNYRFDVIEIDLNVNGKLDSEVFHHENIAIFDHCLH